MASDPVAVPIEGMDRKAWESDYVQFPRLLATIYTGGLIEGDYVALEKLGMKRDEVDAILKRGIEKWGRILDSYEPKRGKRGKQRVVKFH